MNQAPLPYITECTFCGQGLLRFLRCRHCGDIAAVCDECELVWQYVATVRQDPTTPASAVWPVCPACQSDNPGWERLDADRVRQAGLAKHIAGESP